MTLFFRHSNSDILVHCFYVFCIFTISFIFLKLISARVTFSECGVLNDLPNDYTFCCKRSSINGFNLAVNGSVWRGGGVDYKIDPLPATGRYIVFV